MARYSARYVMVSIPIVCYDAAKITVISGWVFSAAISLSIVYGIHGDITAENKSSVGVAALYNAVARSVWGACVSWVIIACSSGYGGPVTALLSWKPFVVLSRLTFMAYLVHPSVIMVYLNNQEALYASNDVHNAITYLGLMVIIYMVSFLLMLALESPVIALDKVWLRNSRKVARDVR
uniref:Acyltransferase 3 domain-containing protein n=1 Tax=Biomphalaria glabrata TaxID=6526 RepID=A0A2C9L313_BIOGL